MSDTPNDLSRRKMLARLGTLAAAAYTVPAFTTMSMAHASDGGSAASANSSASSPSEPSEPSEASAPSEASGPSDPSGASEASMASGPSNADDCSDSGGNWDDAAGTCTLPE